MNIAVNFKDAEQFQRALNDVIYSSRAISNVDHLKGRSAEVDNLTRALHAPGRQPFIYGLRGAGKTSLALSTAEAYSHVPNVLVACAPQMRFGDIVRSLAMRALNHNPLQASRTVEKRGNGSVKLFGVAQAGGSVSEATNFAGMPSPQDPNEALAILKKVAETKGERFCFIIDEFDQLIDTDSHLQLGLLAKLIADDGAGIKFILCGVADDVQQIFKAHASTLRLFEPIEVNRLGLQACFDIMADVEKRLQVEIERETKFRIAQISDGFPYFIHLITEKTMWRWFTDPNHNREHTSPVHYEQGLRDASNSAAPELKDPYELAVSKYALDGEIIVWALATGNPLEKQIKVIHKDFAALYETIPLKDKPKYCLNQNQISSRLSLFMSDAYGCMVARPRRSYYAFKEKRMRGYARIRAELRDVALQPDHPLMPRRD